MLDSIKKKFQFRFKDRENAANILAAALEDFLEKEDRRGREGGRKNTLILVLGIPRGGVIIADIVAKNLKASDFDIVLPRKLRIPHNEEAAFGAIMEDGTIYLDDRLVKDLDISEEYIEKEKNLQLQEIERRKSLYRNTSKQHERELGNKINDKTIVILIDDGAASGATVIAAARSIRKNSLNNAKELIIALPVAPKETVGLLRKEAADHVEVVTAPSSFFNSVGQFYQNFQPVSDEQVIEIMKKWNLL
ncbi:MAG TPA: phosphoribosyltransferase family protein [Nitrososphaeraceae archaeon]|nr:phosphoribosyltransferase family protein [Nitrososphaeraceae archaeon]